MQTSLNTAELTTMHGETLAEMRLEKTLANIARRAENLLADGYRVNADNRPDPTGVNYVHGPKGQLYRVNHWDGSAEFPDAEHSCDCAAWATYGTCKHYLAVDRLVQEGAEADAAAERAEEARTFFRESAARF